MRRWILVATGLAALLWAVAARTPSAAPVDIIAMAGVGSCPLGGDSDDTSQQWRAQQHTIAAVTESVWKSAPVHAALAATRAPRTFDPPRASNAPDPPVRPTPHYLRHTPLLI